MVERKIINVDDSAPLISKKKKKQAAVTFASVIAIVIIVVVVILLTTADKIQKVGNFSITKVISGPLTTSTEASGSVVLPTQVSIVSMETGYVSKLFVEVGDSVTSSTILATLNIPELEQDLVDLQNDIETKEISLEQTLLSHEYAIKELTIDLKRLEKDITDSKADLVKVEELKNLKSSRESDYDDAIDNLEDLNNQKEDLLLDLEKENRQGALSIRSKEAELSQLKTNLSRVESDLADANIKSPISGDVISIDQKLFVPGSRVTQSTELFTVANTSDVYIDLEVYEEHRTVLEVGGIMEILISSNIIEAEILQIGSVASLSSDSLAATITVRAKPIQDVDLTSGASAVATIPLGTKEDALILPRGSYLTTGNQKYVYIVDGDMAYKTEVTYGTIDGTEVEIISGLEAGDKIIISSYQSFIDQETIELK
ncbi:MAG: efflux RND transporter periplasmic adaptor subunit [Spirochaetaceae bacterium]